MAHIESVIFDIGGVLIDWNPRYLYRKIFAREEEVTWFLENICTPDWNDRQDAGRPFEEATEELVTKHPEWEYAIRAWYGRWKETIGGPVEGTVQVLEALKQQNHHRLFALTNWSAETFPWAREHFHFLHWFEGIVVSGEEKTRKPFPEIYNRLFQRYKVEPERTLFIDDSPRNIEGAKALGLKTLRFESPEQVRRGLTDLGLLK
jgi:2-haloacid dehalogenase